MYLIGGIVGALVGYAYYHFVGCVNGTCAIQSNPFFSTLYGATFGGLLLSMFKLKRKKYDF
jgi:uncharacterized membrane protein YeaQ/YmgE (transglycosylase-associated protein family)